MKPDCNAYRQKIAAYVLGELSGEEVRALEAHEAVCLLCRSERDRYAQTMRLLRTVGDEEVPRHFYVSPEEQSIHPWHAFRQMRAGWRAAVAFAAMLLLLTGIAAVSRFRVQSGPDGWTCGFGRDALDLPALKKELLDAAEKRDQEAKAMWIREMRGEFQRLQSEWSPNQRAQWDRALAAMDAKIAARMDHSEWQIREDAQSLVAAMYQHVARQRAQDLAAIHLRFEGMDASNAMKSQQTNEVLGTLLQYADMRLKP